MHAIIDKMGNVESAADVCLLVPFKAEPHMLRVQTRAGEESDGL